MLNQTKRLYKSKSKSKIFITILCIFGLLFSYSCKCRNQISDPNNIPLDNGIKTNETPPPQGTFSMSAATDNVTDNFVVKSDSTVGEIKIAFVSANDYDYTLSYEVVDNDTTGANRITTEETTYENNVLTIKEEVVKKVRNLYSSAGPVEKTITINFTFKAKDTTLQNNTQTLSVEVKLTRAQTYADDGSKKTFIEKVLQRGLQIDGEDNTDLNNIKQYLYKFSEGEFNIADNTFTIKNSHTEKGNLDISKATLKRYTDHNVGNLGKPEISSAVFNSAEGGGETDDYYTLIYGVTFADSYEVGITQIKVKFEKQPESNKTPNKFVD